MYRPTLFTCPICSSPLIGDRSLRCENGHCYDRAKSGYINLLSGKGGNHGDPKDMVLARRAFLDGGYYRPLADKLAEAVATVTESGVVLDLGCGECYYTKIVYDVLTAYGRDISVSGIDVSKDAVNYGSRRFPQGDLAVASVYAIPAPDSCADTVLSVFSPAAIDEFIRVLKPGGHLIMVIGGRDHLWSLKQAVYDTPYRNQPADYHIEGLEYEGKQVLKYDIELKGDDIKNLFMMTPYYHKTSRGDIAKLDSLDILSTEVEFEILSYRAP